ncbi:hypothetical protein [Angustibacter sp. Root456]|uniref:hypothetical protein n=1 Tax=Angustibacter sp. Root456 TaxID=1736539 RepID=UPI0006F4665E|nr:hypothetical protein [Angustibacter sp. Root456]KQX61688.1 hypothetical protein ASD06_13920 [Angustibacter sp. Root456]
MTRRRPALAETGDATSASASDVRAGARLLISGEAVASSGADGPWLAWGCGFTRRYSAAEAGRWVQAAASR